MQPKKSADINLHDIALMYSWGDSQSDIANTLNISKTTVNTALKQKNLAYNFGKAKSQVYFLEYINQSLQNDKKKLRRLLLLQSVLLIVTSVIYAIL